MKYTNHRSYAVRVGDRVVEPGETITDEPAATVEPDPIPPKPTTKSRKATKSEEDAS